MTDDWRAEAECRGTPLAIFYQSDGQPKAEARQMCAACPVLAECRAANDLEERTPGDVFGFIAGETPGERLARRWSKSTANKYRREAKARRVKPCGTSASYFRGCRCDPCVAAEALRYQVQKYGLPLHLQHKVAS